MSGHSTRWLICEVTKVMLDAGVKGVPEVGGGATRKPQQVEHGRARRNVPKEGGT